MKITLCLVLVLFTSTAFAQKIYKCTSENGTTIFSKYECGANSKIIDTTSANKTIAPSSGIAGISESAALSSVDLDCANQLNAIDNEYQPRIGALQNEIEQLRKSMEYSRNNLAGSTRNEGLQTQISGIEARIAATETARDTRIGTTRDACSAKHSAELNRQDTARQQRAAEADKAAQDKADQIKAKAEKSDAVDGGG